MQELNQTLKTIKSKTRLTAYRPRAGIVDALRRQQYQRRGDGSGRGCNRSCRVMRNNYCADTRHRCADYRRNCFTRKTNVGRTNPRRVERLRPQRRVCCKVSIADVGGGGYERRNRDVPLPRRHARGIRRHRLQRRTQTPRVRNRGLTASVDFGRYAVIGRYKQQGKPRNQIYILGRRDRGGLAVIKKIKELTAAEIDHYCDDRRDQNQTNKPYNACVACPLRWARQCSACVPIMPQHLVTRMYKAIGDRNINITSEVKINEN